MITETAQTAQLPFVQPEGEVRTPEEIMVTLLAQTIIITSNTPLPKGATLERPFGMEKQQEGERTSEKREAPKYSKSDSIKSPEKASEKTTTAAVKPVDGEPHSEKPTMTTRSMVKSERSPEARSEAESSAPRSSEGPKPTMTKSPVTPLHQPGSVRHESGRAAEGRTSSRQAAPESPLRNHLAHNSPLLKVDKDREESQHQKRHFQKGKFKKGKENRVIGTEKVAHVAEKRFQPEKRADYESFLRTMMQDSDLSGFFGVRVSHFDVMLLFIELMKLEVEDNHQERTSRLEERRYQITWMEAVVKQYKSQAKLLLFAGVGAGVLGVLSGALPIVGHVGGDFILDKLKMVYKGFEGMKRAKVFDNLSKMCFSMSEMNKAMGQVQSSFCEGERSWAEHKSSLHRTDGEESTRTIEERTREFKNWNDILAQLLRMEQDLVRQLYN